MVSCEMYVWMSLSMGGDSLAATIVWLLTWDGSTSDSRLVVGIGSRLNFGGFVS